jgi:hypothetical protein
VDWCYSGFEGPVVESCGIGEWWRKIKECMGEFIVACYLEMLKMASLGLLRVYGPNFDYDKRYL